MNIEPSHFYNNKNQKIAAKIYSATPRSESGVIFCHGLFSTKEGIKITKMANDIVNAGFTLLTFDFSFCGESEGNLAELSVLQEVDDLNAAFHYFKKSGIRNVHLIGSSMGALVSMLFSSIMSAEIRSQSLIAAPVLLHELMESMAGKDIDEMHEDGFTTIDGISIHNRFFMEADKIDIEKAVSGTCIPTLVIHGALDTVVPVYNSAALLKNINCEKRMVLIEDGDHQLIRDSDIEIISKNIIEWITGHNA